MLSENFIKTGKPIYMSAKYFKSLQYKFFNKRERIRGKKCVLSHSTPESDVLKNILHKFYLVLKVSSTTIKIVVLLT